MLPALQFRQFVILSLPAQPGGAKDLISSARSTLNLFLVVRGGAIA